MSDLSRLLDDVYGTGGSSQSPPEPAWASEEALDEVFASWVPGSLDDAPAAEAPAPPAPAPRVDPVDSFADSDIFGSVADAPAAPLEDLDAFAAAAPLEPLEDLDAFAAAAAAPPVALVTPVAPMTPEPAPMQLPPIEDLFDAFAVTAPAPAPAPLPPVETFEPAESFAVFEVPAAPVAAVADLDGFRQSMTAPHVEVLAQTAPAALAPWQPSDDDLLPARKRGFNLSLSLRRR